MNRNQRSRPIIFLVARREILIRLRSRVFTFGTAGMIALIVAGVVVASILAGRTSSIRVGFAGTSQTLEQAFRSSATALGANVTVSDVTDATAGQAQVSDGALDVLVTRSPTGPTVVVKDTVPSQVEAALNSAVFAARLTQAGLKPSDLASAMAGAHVQVESLKPTDPQRTQNEIAGLGVGILLFVALGFYGSFVAQGVVEEKATRIMEILLATVRPTQLLAGKIIGIGLVAMLQLSLVGAATLVAVDVTKVVSIPAFSPTAILGYLVWFLLGFLLYSTAYAAVAALVSRQEEVSGAVAPLQIVLLLSYLLVYVAIPNPSSPLITFLSILPPFAPILMSVRMAGGDAALWQVVLGMATTLVSIVGLTWLAGRVYANAALNLGTRVRFWDALRG